jgi:hypothetical protein
MQYVSDRKQHYVIDASKPWHLAWWAEQFGVSEDELVEAMLVVGTDAGAVAEFIKQAQTEEPVH